MDDWILYWLFAAAVHNMLDNMYRRIVISFNNIDWKDKTL